MTGPLERVPSPDDLDPETETTLHTLAELLGSDSKAAELLGGLRRLAR